MKYEMIFGDEKLFDGAPEDAVIAIKRPFISGVRSEKMYFFSGAYDAILEAGSSFNFNNVIFKTNEYAERRIIKEPKRWTWEDKKAGLLPEVGSDVLCSNGKTIYTIEAVNKNENQLCVRDGDDGDLAITYTQYVTPIETPAEKAQREEDEFVDSITKCTPTNDYSTGYTEGLRAAYRKLKGGE